MLVEARGRPGDRGGSEGVDSVRGDRETMENSNRHGFGIYSFIREVSRPGLSLLDWTWGT